MPECLALLLVLSPLDPPEWSRPVVAPALARLNRTLELADDPPERYSVLATELDWTRRNLPLAWEAPPLSDAARLPDLLTLQCWAAFNGEYQDHLRARAVLSPRVRDAAEDALADCRRRAETIRLMQVAVSQERPACRRRALMDLRERLGWDRYYAGRWGTPIDPGGLAWVE